MELLKTVASLGVMAVLMGCNPGADAWNTLGFESRRSHAKSFTVHFFACQRSCHQRRAQKSGPYGTISF